MIIAPTSVAVVLVILGVLAYLSDGVKKARERQRRKAAQELLKQDIQAPEPSTQLPYGFSGEADSGAARE